MPPAVCFEIRGNTMINGCQTLMHSAQRISNQDCRNTSHSWSPGDLTPSWRNPWGHHLLLPVTYRFSQDEASRAGLIARKWLLPPQKKLSDVDSRSNMAYFQLTGHSHLDLPVRCAGCCVQSTWPRSPNLDQQGVRTRALAVSKSASLVPLIDLTLRK